MRCFLKLYTFFPRLARLAAAVLLVFGVPCACGGNTSATGNADVVQEDTPCCGSDAFDVAVLDLGFGLKDAEPGEDSANSVVLPQNQTIPVSNDACCLSVAKNSYFWSAGGAIYEHHWSSAITRLVVDGPNEQTEPVSDGEWLAWTDRRTGDWDIWVLHFPTGEARIFAGGPGDQHSPDLAAGWLTWVGTNDSSHGPEHAEIWAANLNGDARFIRLTEDDVEQAWPQIDGDRVVFTDFSNDPDKKYLPGLLPDQNNGDIMGVTLSTLTGFEVIVDPAKQIRPAIDGDVVAWLDWRGITPEPKFVVLQVALKNISTGEERVFPRTNWPNPELWQRPVLDGQWVAWAGQSPITGRLGLRVATHGGQITDIASVSWPLGGIVLFSDHVGWISAGELAFSPIVVPFL